MTVAVIRTYFPYSYQEITYLNVSVSRYPQVTRFYRLSRIRYGMLRFCSVTLSRAHMVYFKSRLHFVNIERVFYGWTGAVRSKSRRWKRKFAVMEPDLTCHALFNVRQFFLYWQTFLTMYVPRLTDRGYLRHTGSGRCLLHWFNRTPMYWEYPYMWVFFAMNPTVHNELINFFVKVGLSRFKRDSFMNDRDLFRFLNFPIHLFSLPRLSQTDPALLVDLKIRTPVAGLRENRAKLLRDERRKRWGKD